MWEGGGGLGPRAGGILVKSEPEALPARALQPPAFCGDPQGGESSGPGSRWTASGAAALERAPARAVLVAMWWAPP